MYSPTTSRNVPRIAQRVLIRIVLFYILTLLLISFDIPYTYKNLSTASTATSPFTIIFNTVGSKIGGSFMNVGGFSVLFLLSSSFFLPSRHANLHPRTVILTSVLSAANMGTYGSSRILYGMALRGHAPRQFAYLTKRGVPWLSTLAIVFIALVMFGLSFLPGGAGQIWVWAQALVGVRPPHPSPYVHLSRPSYTSLRTSALPPFPPSTLLRSSDFPIFPSLVRFDSY
jgi:AAT family amino acid transporter